MAVTVEQQRAADERDAALAELKRQRAVKAAELAALDAKLEQVADADFMARVGSADLRTLTIKEKAEIVAKIGPAKFAELVAARR